MQRLKLKDKPVPNSTVRFQVYRGEKIVTAIFGIMAGAVTLKEFFKVMKCWRPWVHEPLRSENSLVITNQRLLFIRVPTEGGALIPTTLIGDATASNFMFNRSEIHKEGKKILTQPFSKILGYGKMDVLFTEIKTITLKNKTIITEMATGDKLMHYFLDEEYLEPLKKSLRQYLKEKFIEK